MKHAMVLLSGGLDSTTVAAHAVAKGYETRALAIRYGQRHERELESAQAVARKLGIPCTEVDARFYGQLAAYSALTNVEAHDVPTGREPAEMASEVPITYVPLRNTFFVTVAAAALESWLLVGIEGGTLDPGDVEPVVLVGANAIDYSGYPDCRPEFYAALEETLRQGSKLGSVYGRGIAIEAPIIEMTKPEIVRYALELGAPLAETWSCYLGAERPCGACDSCELRAAAFAGAGVPDPALARS